MMDLFDKEGDRNNRSKARIRFNCYRLGDEEFTRLFNTYVDSLKQNENLTLKIQKNQSYLNQMKFILEMIKESLNKKQRNVFNSYPCK